MNIKNIYSQTSRLKKTGGASASPQSRKIPVFGCAFALCTMQNSLLVISLT
jgi:hypothetical protein